jgi:hypothetical protein
VTRSKAGIFVSTACVAILTMVQISSAANKYAGEFLTHGVGARALGMGSAFVAVADDVTAGYWNPAGLADVRVRAVQLMHSETFGDVVNYDTGATVIPLSDGAVGLTFVRLAVDDIPFTDFEQDENRIYYSEAGITWESDAEMAMLVSYARGVNDRLNLGGNLKMIRKNIAEFTCYGLGFDLGAKYRLWSNTTLGANIQDVTTTFLSWSTKERERILPTAKLGLAQRFDLPSMEGVLTLAADADLRFENRRLSDQYHAGPVSADTHYGAEFLYRRTVAVRAGVAMGQLTAGAGVQLGAFTVDYAFGKHQYLDSSHRISASYAF